MPKTPTQKTVPTMASAALPPLRSMSMPMLLQCLFSDATAPSLFWYAPNGSLALAASTPCAAAAAAARQPSTALDRISYFFE